MRLLPFLLFGVLLGAFFFQAVVNQKRILELGIAVIALGFVAFQLSRNALFARLAHHKPGRTWGIILGTLAGFTSMIAHVGGPLVTIYLLPQKLTRDLFVGTSVLLFFITNVVKLLPYSLLGLLHIGNFMVILVLLPFTFIGTRLGIILNRYFSEVIFSRFIYLLLALTGFQLLFGKNLMASLAQRF